LFDLKASLARKTAVMRADFALAQTLRQLVRHAFDQTARVDKNQRRAVRLNLRHELIVDRGPDILADNRSQLFIGHLNMKLHRALVTDVDNGTVARAPRENRAGANQKTGVSLYRFLRRAKADPLQRSLGQCIQTLER